MDERFLYTDPVEPEDLPENKGDQPMTTPLIDRRNDIKETIDRCTNFAEFLELVAEICNDKANHVRSNWQDDLLADIWTKRAELVGEVSNLVEFEIETGTTVLEIAGERIRDKYFVPLEGTKCPHCGFISPDKE